MFRQLAKALIRLRVCAGSSEALLVAHTTFMEISCHGLNGRQGIRLLTSETNFSIRASHVDQDQTAPHCLLQRGFERTSRRHTPENIYSRLAAEELKYV